MMDRQCRVEFLTSDYDTLAYACAVGCVCVCVCVRAITVYVCPHYRKVKSIYDVHHHIFSLVTGKGFVFSIHHMFSQQKGRLIAHKFNPGWSVGMVKSVDGRRSLLPSLQTSIRTKRFAGLKN